MDDFNRNDKFGGEICRGRGNLVHDIFDNMKECIPMGKEAGRIVDLQIKKAAEEYAGRLGVEDTEGLRDLCFEVSHMAGREWFVAGFYYAAGLLFRE